MMDRRWDRRWVLCVLAVATFGFLVSERLKGVDEVIDVDQKETIRGRGDLTPAANFPTTMSSGENQQTRDGAALNNNRTIDDDDDDDDLLHPSEAKEPTNPPRKPSGLLVVSPNFQTISENRKRGVGSGTLNRTESSSSLLSTPVVSNTQQQQQQQPDDVKHQQPGDVKHYLFAF